MVLIIEIFLKSLFTYNSKTMPASVNDILTAFAMLLPLHNKDYVFKVFLPLSFHFIAASL